LLKGKNLKEIVKITEASSCNLNLHKIILYERRYIHKTYEALDKGSIVMKRLLMSAGYVIIWNVIDIDRGKSEGGVFESLQEEKTMDDYGDVLGRLVCMYIRMIDLEDQFGENDHGLTAMQKQELQDLRKALMNDEIDEELDRHFHAVFKELFY